MAMAAAERLFFWMQLSIPPFSPVPTALLYAGRCFRTSYVLPYAGRAFLPTIFFSRKDSKFALVGVGTASSYTYTPTVRKGLRRKRIG